MLRGYCVLKPLPYAHPREVQRQIFGRHAAQHAVNPALEALVVVVDRLYVEHPFGSRSGAPVVGNCQGLDLDAQVLFNSAEGAAAVDTQERVRRGPLSQRVQSVRFGQARRAQDAVGNVGLPAHVQHQHRDRESGPLLVQVCPIAGQDAAPCPRGPGHATAALEALPEERLVRLQHPGKCPPVVAHGRLEESVPPAQGSAQGHAHGNGRLADGQACRQMAALLHEPLLVAQAGEGRTAGAGEGPTAVLAGVALQASSVPVLDDVGASTAGAAQHSRSGALYRAQRLVAGVQPGRLLDERLQLSRP